MYAPRVHESCFRLSRLPNKHVPTESCINIPPKKAQTLSSRGVHRLSVQGDDLAGLFLTIARQDHTQDQAADHSALHAKQVPCIIRLACKLTPTPKPPQPVDKAPHAQKGGT